MCGIAGIARRGGAPADEADAVAVERMIEFLAHRGPDGSGVLRRGSVVLAARFLEASGDSAAVATLQAVRIWDPAALVGIDRSPSLTNGAAFGEVLLEHDRSVTMPEQMLVKVDRASMAVGLEARPPLQYQQWFDTVHRATTS